MSTVSNTTQKPTQKPAAQSTPHPASRLSAKLVQKSTPEPAQRNRQKPPLKRTILYVLALVLWTGLAFVASQLLFSFLFALILGTTSLPPIGMFFYYLLSYATTLVLLFFVSPKLHRAFRLTPAELGVANPPTFVDLGLAPVGYAVYLLVATLLTALMSLFPWFDAAQSQDIGFSYYLSPPDRIFAMLAVVFIAPICEELIMRGWLYGKLRSRLGIIAATLLTSLVFALLHGQWNISITVFGLSLVLCALREITGTVWSSMLLHILSNGIAFYLLYVAQIMI